MTVGNVNLDAGTLMAVSRGNAGKSDIISFSGKALSFGELFFTGAGTEKEANASTKNPTILEFNNNSESAKALKVNVKDVLKTGAQNEATPSNAACRKISEDIRNVIKEELGLSDEQFEEILAQLGMVPTDLLMPQNLAEFIAQVKNTDVAAIVTDGDLMNHLTDIIKELSVRIETIAKAEGISGEELVKGAENFEKALLGSKAEDAAESGKVKPVGAEEKNDVDETVKYSETDAKKEEVSLNEKVSAANDGETKMSGEYRSSKGNSGDTADKKQEGSLLGTLTNAVDNALGNAQVTNEFGEALRTNGADIVSQMLDAIKANVTSEVKVLEIQLTPENLGKVNLSVESKNGVITATITAQNDTARNAIAEQIAVLKDTLNNQGLKVENVEVAVSANGFDFTRDDAENRGNGQNTKTAKKFRDFPEDFSEEAMNETIEEEMMLQEGNSISYKA